ncbi:MAG: hypothetical protein ILO36_00835 [Abditibacteriota bacterium]|nr:hypothetical protein [Abditibacteriota bacterium]
MSAVSFSAQREPDGSLSYAGGGYRAVFSQKDACLSHLWIGGADVMDGHRFYSWCSQIHQPAFFSREWDLRETVYGGEMKREEGRVVCTVPDMGVVTYELAPESIKIRVRNTFAGANHFLMAFRGDLVSIGRPRIPGKIVSPGTVWQPGTSLTPGTYRWVAGGAGFESRGAAVWEQAPYTFSSISAHLVLEEGEEKEFELIPFIPSEEEAAEEFKNSPAPENAPIEILSPRDMQVFQRSGRYTGAVLVSGSINVVFDKAYYRITGKGINGKKYPEKWQPLSAGGGVFNVSVPGYAGGWYKLEIKAEKRGAVAAEASVEHFGIGEVFVGAGQSNSTNWGQELIEQDSGMVSMTDGTRWQKLEGAVIGCHDRSGGGSYYAALGDILYKEFGVPVGIASTGHGGSVIEHWGRGGELYSHMLERMRQLGPGGFRAVLWHQGESNASSDPEKAFDAMAELIEWSRKDAGWHIPWFVAKVSYNNAEAAKIEPIRSVHQRLWDEGIALEGPDTDELTGDMRDYGGEGIHFSPKGLRAHAAMWADKLAPFIKKSFR